MAFLNDKVWPYKLSIQGKVICKMMFFYKLPSNLVSRKFSFDLKIINYDFLHTLFDNFWVLFDYVKYMLLFDLN